MSASQEPRAVPGVSDGSRRLLDGEMRVRTGRPPLIPSLSDAQIADITQQRLAGVQWPEIASGYGCRDVDMFRTFRRLGLAFPKRPRKPKPAPKQAAYWSPEEDRRLVELRCGGVLIKDIAPLMGRTYDATESRSRRLQRASPEIGALLSSLPKPPRVKKQKVKKVRVRKSRAKKVAALPAPKLVMRLPANISAAPKRTFTSVGPPKKKQEHLF